jgi:hypothetical protein
MPEGVLAVNSNTPARPELVYRSFDSSNARRNEHPLED